MNDVLTINFSSMFDIDLKAANIAGSTTGTKQITLILTTLDDSVDVARTSLTRCLALFDRRSTSSLWEIVSQ